MTSSPNAFSRQESLRNENLGTLFTSAINPKITAENINTFADTALNDLISITGKTVDKYKDEYPGETRTGRELEDAAFAEYGRSDENYQTFQR
jgi:hypothetical protein